MIKKKLLSKKFIFITLVITLLATPIVLVLSTSLGIRPSGDDFSLVVLTRKDFVDYHHTFFTLLNGRFTNAFSIYVFYKYAPGIFIFLTPFIYVGTIASGSYVLYKWAFYKLGGKIDSRYASICLTLLTTFGCLVMPINRYQAYYWLPGLISYGLPFVLTIVLAAVLVRVSGSKTSLFSYGLFALVAAVIGGFNELAAITGAYFVLAAAGTSLLWVQGHSLREKLKRLQPCMFVLLGFVGSFFINFYLPATQYRRSIAQVNHLDFKRVLYLSFEFLTHTLTLPRYILLGIFITLVSLVLSLAFISVDLLAVKRAALRPIKILATLFVISISPAVTLSLITLLSLTGQGGNPPERAYLPYELSLVLSLVLLGVALALVSAHGIKRLNLQMLKALRNCSAVAAAIVLAIGVYSTQGKLVAQTRQIRERASVFDQQEVHIKDQLAKNNSTLYIKPLPIGGVAAPTGDPLLWINENMADYYRVDAVIAQ